MVQEALQQSRYLPFDYGDLKLPKCSEQETAIRNLELDFDELYRPRKRLAKELCGLKGSAALSAIDSAVENYVMRKAAELDLPEELMQHLDHAVKAKDWRGVPD